jgi:hypothetical protein
VRGKAAFVYMEDLADDLAAAAVVEFECLPVLWIEYGIE